MVLFVAMVICLVVGCVLAYIIGTMLYNKEILSIILNMLMKWIFCLFAVISRNIWSLCNIYYKLGYFRMVLFMLLACQNFSWCIIFATEKYISFVLIILKLFGGKYCTYMVILKKNKLTPHENLNIYSILHNFGKYPMKMVFRNLFVKFG